MTEQIYEEYWRFTVGNTRITSNEFIDMLRIVVLYIDKLNQDDIIRDKESITKYYRELQDEVFELFPKNKISNRKCINQFVKMGFISPYLVGYHKLTKKYLRARSDEERLLLFSQIFYTSASLSSAVTVNDTQTKQINFLLKTLMYHPAKKLDADDLAALMLTKISAVTKGYLTSKELEQKKLYASKIGFSSRKYNQIGYIRNFLKKLPGITVYKNEISYTENALEVLPASTIDVKRDPTLFRYMKEQLFRESREFYNGKVVCYFTKKEQKGLVVSHIYGSAEALKKLDVEAAYDYRNALLLEQNTDMYFDKHDLSFEDSGKPLFGLECTADFEDDHIKDSLDSVILYPERLKYLAIHRKIYVEKQKKFTEAN